MTDFLALSFQSTTIGFSNSRINPSVQKETPVTTRVLVNQPLFTVYTLCLTRINRKSRLEN